MEERVIIPLPRSMVAETPAKTIGRRLRRFLQRRCGYPTAAWLAYSGFITGMGQLTNEGARALQDYENQCAWDRMPRHAQWVLCARCDGIDLPRVREHTKAIAMLERRGMLDTDAKPTEYGRALVAWHRERWGSDHE